MITKITQIVSDEMYYLWSEITFQSGWVNYFWMLTLISIVVAVAEKTVPWRKDQPVIRKQFWLDITQMYFNFFIFKVIFLSWVGFGLIQFTSNILHQPLTNFALWDLSTLPRYVQIIIFFIVLDFVQWLVHISLHRIPLLWEFHKVHHSVKEMSFPAHLRFHWMEHIVYTPVKYLAVTLLFGFPPQLAVISYVLSTVIGHINHANLKITYGPLKYIFNNPVMHLWHHSYTLPKGHRYGVNFGISLSIWDYIFKTAIIPDDSGTIALGFSGDENFPTTFWGQMTYPLSKHSHLSLK